MEFCLNTTIPDAINLQFEDQPCTFNPHVERKVQVVEFDAFGGCQAREQTLRHVVQICGKCAHVDKTFAEGVRCEIHITGYQIVFDNQ